MLHDWSTLTSAVLDDSQMEERGHSGNLHLVSLLCAAVRRVQEGATAPAAGAKRVRT